jgi:hypothetical protein
MSGFVEDAFPSGRLVIARYLVRMRKPRQALEEAEARRAYLKRGERIRSGTLPGLLENGKTVRPEIREMIDAAVAKRRC